MLPGGGFAGIITTMRTVRLGRCERASGTHTMPRLAPRSQAVQYSELCCRRKAIPDAA